MALTQAGLLPALTVPEELNDTRLEKPQKTVFFCGPAGKGVSLATKKRYLFFEALKNTPKNVATELEGH